MLITGLPVAALRTPVPFVVSARAAPPRVADTWKVSVVAPTTKYVVLIEMPVVDTMVANETVLPFTYPCAVRLTVSPTSVNVTALPTNVANETSSLSDSPCATKLIVSPVSVVVTAIAVVDGVPTPVTCMPVVMPVVLAIVTTVLPAVVVPDNATGVTAPQFVDTVITNPCVFEVPSPANTDSKPAWDNFAEA